MNCIVVIPTECVVSCFRTAGRVMYCFAHTTHCVRASLVSNSEHKERSRISTGKHKDLQGQGNYQTTKSLMGSGGPNLVP